MSFYDGETYFTLPLESLESLKKIKLNRKNMTTKFVERMYKIGNIIVSCLVLFHLNLTSIRWYYQLGSLNRHLNYVNFTEAPQVENSKYSFRQPKTAYKHTSTVSQLFRIVTQLSVLNPSKFRKVFVLKLIKSLF